MLLLDIGFFKALWRALQYGIDNMGVTAALIAVPVFFAFMFSSLKIYTPYFVKVYPELVLWSLTSGVIISLVADVFVTSSSTLLFIKTRSAQKTND